MTTLSKVHRFLLISNAQEKEKSQYLLETLCTLGDLQIAREKEAAKAISKKKYDLLIIDSGAVQDVISLVYSLHRQQPKSRFLVVTASPTWQVAREMFRAGASDYLDRSLTRSELCSRVKAVLALPPLP
jgi:DNA-binding NarL/FixJ family response regulator